MKYIISVKQETIVEVEADNDEDAIALAYESYLDEAASEVNAHIIERS